MHGDLKKVCQGHNPLEHSLFLCSFQHRLEGAQGVCGMARCGGQCAAVLWGLARGVAAVLRPARRRMGRPRALGATYHRCRARVRCAGPKYLPSLLPGGVACTASCQTST